MTAPTFSQFNLVIPLEGMTDVLVFNTLAGSAVLVTQDTAAAMMRLYPKAKGEDHMLFRQFGPSRTTLSHQEHAHEFILPEDTMSTLAELGMIVSSPIEEQERVNNMLESYWNPRTLKLTLAYTADCQMACAYCFQSGRKLSEHHGPELQESTLHWVQSYLNEHPEIESIHLGLFGGEPLANVQLANQYIDRLFKITSARQLGFSMSLTTNGLNLSRQLIADWQGKGLEYIRVTLDGPPEIHDKRRSLLSGEGSFATILNNLLAIKELEGFGLGVSINLDTENVSHVAELLDILAEAGLANEVEIILEPTMPHVSKLIDHELPGALPGQTPALMPGCIEEFSGGGNPRRTDLKNPDVAGGVSFGQDKSCLSKLLTQALTQVIEKGFRTPLYPGLCKPCNFVQANNFVIGWDGQLFRCTFTMLDQSMVVGHVKDGVNSRNNELLKARQVVDYCLNNHCAYLPVCGGGCRYEASLRGGNWYTINCPLVVWDSLLPLSITHALGLHPLSQYLHLGSHPKG